MMLQAGHALAAASEGVGVHHIAAFSMLLLPGAYVALDADTLAVLGPWRTLRVSLPGLAAWSSVTKKARVPREFWLTSSCLAELRQFFILSISGGFLVAEKDQGRHISN